ncbi:hypothetical protein [Streptomyces sp. NPDC048659]|uniref:hypothetical protein n=1 Tax=Streptomyces sp. NPDC048659 TaxID=3155489 RepID=UPI00341ABC93
MADRAHPTQQDDALRQARHDTLVRTTASALITAIAEYLADTRPGDYMVEASRQYLASSYAKAHATLDSAFAEELTARLLKLMPTPHHNEHRGTYAQRLRSVAGKAGA